jgi:hypothetical protein
MREVKIKVVDVRNPTHRVLKLDEPKAEEYNNLSSSDEKSQIQVGSNTELEMDGDLEGEEVKIERTTGEKVPERKDMSRTTPMDGKSNWPKASKNYEFDATLKKTRNQLDLLKASIKLKKGYKEGLMLETADLKRASMEVFNWRPGGDIEQLKQLSTSAKMNGLNQMKNPNYYDIWEAAQLGNYDSNEKSYWDKITSITLEALTELEQGNYSL